MKFIDRCGGVYGIDLHLIKKDRETTTCNRWDLKHYNFDQLCPKMILPDTNSMIKTIILWYTMLFIEIVETMIMFGQTLWDIDKLVDSPTRELKVAPLKIAYILWKYEFSTTWVWHGSCSSFIRKLLSLDEVLHNVVAVNGAWTWHYDCMKTQIFEESLRYEGPN